MIPFDLAQFDEPGNADNTAAAIENLAKQFLGKAGLEREGAAMLLSRLYMRYLVPRSIPTWIYQTDYCRKDTRSNFHSFLEWANVTLQGPADVFLVSLKTHPSVLPKSHIGRWHSSSPM
jgi:hypothetical protein